MRLNPLVLLGGSGSLLWGLFFGIQAYGAFGGNQDIHWTARTMPLRIEQTEDAFEFFIGGSLIQEHLSAGTLWLSGEGGLEPLAAADVAVRLNHWPEVKSLFLTHALWSGMVFAACLTLFVVGSVRSLAAAGSHRRRAGVPDGLPAGAPPAEAADRER